MISGNTFTCPITGLSITKPDRWEFMPGPWTRPEREILVAPTEEGQAILQSGNDPIVCFFRPHGSSRDLNPTVQVFRRAFSGPADFDELATAVRATVPTMLHDANIRELTTTAILAGRRALRYVVEYALVGAVEDVTVRFRCRCVGHIVPCHGHGITITVATPSRKAYRFDPEVDAVLGSVRFRE